MQILTRYIIAELMKVLLPVWLGLGIFLFILEWFSKVFHLEAPATVIIAMYAFKIPTYLQLTFPVAVLFSSLAVLGHMNRSREIVALQSLGVSPPNIFLPALLGIVFVSIPYVGISNSLSPWAMKKHFELYDTYVLKVPSRFSKLRNERIWFRNKDVLFNVGYFDSAKDEVYDLSIYTFDENFQVAQTLYASRAKWNGDAWDLHKGTISITDSRLEFPVIETFDKRSTSLVDGPPSLRRIEQGADTMAQGELSRFILRSKELGINTARWEVIYHSRWSFVLISFIFLALAIPVSMKFQRTGSRARDGTFVAATSLVYWILYNVSVNLGNAGKLPPALAAWAPSIAFGAVIFLLFRKRVLTARG